ncbi:MAG: DUF1987 domain-containing protein [Bacteroidales bacterium]|nr:DUF1987 domain-containing protein [Bacteroidales bacterium]
MNRVLESTGTTPSVKIREGHIKILGRSIPTHNINFYHELLLILENYAVTAHNGTIVDIHFEYINCHSEKYMLKVFSIFEKMKQRGKKVVINWHYTTDDEPMFELGQIYHSLTEIPFNFIVNKTA